MAKLFSNMFKAFREPLTSTDTSIVNEDGNVTEDDGNTMAINAMATILGREAAESLTAQVALHIHETEIRQFFVDTLREHNMSETTALTKERFQLADGYTMTVPMTIVFGETASSKSIEPDVD